MSIAAIKPSPPPASPTAGEPRRTGKWVSIDWCDVSSKSLDVNALLELLEFHFGAALGRRAITVLRADELRYMGKGPLGMVIQADHVGSENRFGEREPWVSLRLPGELCRAIGTDAILELGEAIAAAGGMNVARLDLALDDHDKTFSPRWFASVCVGDRLDDEDAQLLPGVVTRVRGDNWEWSRRLGGCFWLGGRKSPRLLRVYDKDRQSKGLIASTRLELQSRDEFAVAMMNDLLAARRVREPIGRVFVEHLVGFVDLREPCGSRSGSQTWKRVPLWQSIVGDAKALSTLPRDDSGVLEWMRAMRRQTRGFLATMLQAADVSGQDLGVIAARSAAGARVAGVLRDIIGRFDRALSAEHRLRLLQLRRERERAAARTGKAPPSAV